MMPQSELCLQVRRVEGVLLRVLGVVVRRGFEPVVVASAPGAEPETFDLTLTVESARPVEGLARHLANLYDVRRVEVRR